MSKGKNWILKRALEEFLERQSLPGLREEARRQSLAASHLSTADSDAWDATGQEVWNER
jgi:hypothetical protein